MGIKESLCDILDMLIINNNESVFNVIKIFYNAELISSASSDDLTNLTAYLIWSSLTAPALIRSTAACACTVAVFA